MYKTVHRTRRYRKKAPYKKRRKANYRKKRVYKKAGGAKLTKMPGRGLPSRVLTKLRYISDPYEITLNNTTTRLACILFRGNNPYDPEYVIGGNQPVYYDFWRNQYMQMRVFGSSIKVSFTAETTTNVIPFRSIIIPSPEGPWNFNQNSRWQDIASNKYATSKISNANFNGVRTGDLHKAPYMSTCKINGMPKTAIKTEDYLCSTDDGTFNYATGSNKKNWFWNIFIANQNLVASNASFDVQATIDYYVEFSHIRPAIDFSTVNDGDLVPESMTGTYMYFPSYTGATQGPANQYFQNYTGTSIALQ